MKKSDFFFLYILGRALLKFSEFIVVGSGSGSGSGSGVLDANFVLILFN